MDYWFIYGLACFLLPNVIWQFRNRKKLEKDYKVRHIIWTYVFMFYVFLAAWYTAGIGTVWDFINNGGLDVTINLLPFQSEGARTYILNVFMFMPLGFLVPLIWRDNRKCTRVVFIGFLFSLTIELFQLFSYRVTDVDDLTMNTFGTFIGYVIWKVFHRIFPRGGEKANAYKVTEPLWYIWLGVLGIFLMYNWRWLR